MKYCVQATWDDVPHITDEMKQELFASIPPYQRNARSKGIPQLGSGAIYHVPEDDIVVPDMPVPEHAPRVYGLDVGWNRTAAVWGWRNNETGVIYLYSEHYRGQAEPSVHVQGIMARGEWIPGVIDPAARGRGQRDGKQLIEDYRGLGLDLEIAKNAVESGIYEVLQLLSSGKLKVYKSLANWLMEYRIYQRDVNGKVIKANDHLMDATRYLILSGRERFRQKPMPKKTEYSYQFSGTASQAWMNFMTGTKPWMEI